MHAKYFLSAIGSGTGSIEVFVNLTYYQPTDLDSLQAQTATFGDLNVSGGITTDRLVVTTATVTGNLTVEGLATVASIVVNGHIITSSGQPVSAAGNAIGQGGVVAIDGNDTAGTITITTGSSGLIPGDLATLSFSELYAKAPRVAMTGQDGHSVRASIYPSAKSSQGFTLSSDEILTPNTTYTFDYFITQ